jgi:hypothetical protein
MFLLFLKEVSPIETNYMRNVKKSVHFAVRGLVVVVEEEEEEEEEDWMLLAQDGVSQRTSFTKALIFFRVP